MFCVKFDAIYADDTTLNLSCEKTLLAAANCNLSHLSCNLILKIKTVGKYFYFSSATLCFRFAKCQGLVLKVGYSSSNIKSGYPELV